MAQTMQHSGSFIHNGPKRKKEKLRLTIRVPSHIDRAAFVLDAIVGTDGETAHPLGLVVVHIQILERRCQASSIGVKGVLSTLRQSGIVSREKEVEILEPIEAGGSLTSDLLI